MQINFDFYLAATAFLLYAVEVLVSLPNFINELKSKKFLSFDDGWPYENGKTWRNGWPWKSVWPWRSGSPWSGNWSGCRGCQWNNTTSILKTIFSFLCVQGPLFLLIIYAASNYGVFLSYINNVVLGNPRYMTNNCTKGEMELILGVHIEIPQYIFHNNVNFSHFVLNQAKKITIRRCFPEGKMEVLILSQCLWLLFLIQMGYTLLVCLANFGDFVFNALFFIAVLLYYLVYRNDYHEHIISGLFRQDKWPVLFFFVVCFAWKNWHSIYPFYILSRMMN